MVKKLYEPKYTLNKESKKLICFYCTNEKNSFSKMQEHQNYDENNEAIGCKA